MSFVCLMYTVFARAMYSFGLVLCEILSMSYGSLQFRLASLPEAGPGLLGDSVVLDPSHAFAAGMRNCNSFVNGLGLIMGTQRTQVVFQVLPCHQ